MEDLLRLVPFVLRHRKALIVSVILSIGAALFAVAQLSLVYPAMNLLLAGKNCTKHVEEQLAIAQGKIDKETQHFDIIANQLADQNWRTVNLKTTIKTLEDEKDRAEADLKAAIRSRDRYLWVQANVLPWIPEDGFNLLAFLLGALLVITLFKETCSFFQEVLVGRVVQRVMQSLREQLFRSTLKLDYQTLSLETTPNLMSRFTYDLSQVSHGMSLMGSKITVEPLKAIICIACAFSANWRLTLLAFVCAPPLGLLFRGVSKSLKRAAQRQMESMSRVYQILDESLSSLKTVQAFRNERLHRRRLSLEHRSFYEKAMRILRLDVFISPSVEFLAMCAVFVASLPGAYLVLRHKTSIWGVQLAAEEMTVSELMLLYTYLMGVLDPGRKLSGIYSKLKKSATACGRVFAWMDRSSLVGAPQDAVEFARHSKSIEFEHVTFHYAQQNSDQLGRKALDDVSLTIPFGATVAVVGENGCGKSTLVNLLPRFFDPHRGTVRIDGVDLADVSLADLRKQIGIVTQDTQLFDWSIAENIRYGKPEANDDELLQAAELAYVTPFVNQMPERFATEIGDKGHRLSGGQRQRIALARAILRNPAILILDEATSAIDTQSERCIHQTLQSFARERTTFIVTHSMTPSLLNVVTHVLVMDEGRVIAFGPHETILKTCPIYQRLFEAQTLKRAG